MALKFDIIGFVVEDIERSLAFYRLLGVPAPSVPEGPHVEAVLPNGLRICWDTIDVVKSFMPNWETPTGHRGGVGFLCDTPEEVDATYARIVEAGYKGPNAPWDAFWGQRYAQLQDPDGNLVDLFAWLPQPVPQTEG